MLVGQQGVAVVRHAATRRKGWFKRSRESLTESVDHHCRLARLRVLKCNRAATQQKGENAPTRSPPPNGARTASLDCTSILYGYTVLVSTALLYGYTVRYGKVYRTVQYTSGILTVKAANRGTVRMHLLTVRSLMCRGLLVASWSYYSTNDLGHRSVFQTRTNISYTSTT